MPRKLTENDIWVIRIALELNRYAKKQLAWKFGVSQSCINRVWNRKRWANVAF